VLQSDSEGQRLVPGHLRRRAGRIPHPQLEGHADPPRISVANSFGTHHRSSHQRRHYGCAAVRLIADIVRAADAANHYGEGSGYPSPFYQPERR
jgi:hypothetical protein